MNTVLRDDNLRLILSAVEKDYIIKEQAYHRQSLIYCFYLLSGFGLYLMLMPLGKVICADSAPLMMLVAVLWGTVCLCVLLMMLFIWHSYRKYTKFMQDHQKFMEQYGRKVM